MPGSWQPTAFIQWAFTLIITIIAHRCWFRFSNGHTATIQKSVVFSMPPAKKFKRKALLIGIEYHDEFEEDKKRAHFDVLSMRQLLIDHYHFDPHDIVTLIDNNKPDQMQPTRDNMIQKMNDLVNGARQGDRFFFYFVGDAVQEEINDENEDGLHGLILTCDGEAIQDNMLFQLLARPLPIGSTLVTIFDCSHSGSLLDLRHSCCNRVYVPWLNKGPCNMATQYNIIGWKNAQLDMSPWLSTIQAPISSAPPSLTEWYGAPGSPILRCETPEPESVFCDGRCHEAVILQHEIGLDADIICLSSAKEDQLAWEGIQLKSMTQILIKILEKNLNPILKDLLTVISHELRADFLLLQMDARMCEKQVRGVNKRRAQKGKEPLGPEYVEINNFQEPEISSPLPLDMSRQWQL